MITAGRAVIRTFLMHRHPTNYLRSLRKRSGLTQDELAVLLGLASQATVSRYEITGILPIAEVLIRTEIVFGKPLRELFPKAFREAEDAVMRRAKILAKDMERKSALSNEDKAKVLAELIRRIEVASRGL
jgi:transcriptional regulator with XRE-family HTH domain